MVKTFYENGRGACTKCRTLAPNKLLINKIQHLMLICAYNQVYENFLLLKDTTFSSSFVYHNLASLNSLLQYNVTYTLTTATRGRNF